MDDPELEDYNIDQIADQFVAGLQQRSNAYVALCVLCCACVRVCVCVYV